MKVGYVGLGAIGASFAAQMQDQGIEVYGLVDQGRKSRYVKEGIWVNETHYDFPMISKEDECHSLDVIFVAVKYDHLETIASLINHHQKSDTIVVSLMNGIDSEEIISEFCLKSHIIHAFVVGIDALRLENRVSYTNQGTIVFGAGFEEAKACEYPVKRLMDMSKIDSTLSDNILKDQWWKFLVNVGINQTSAVLGGKYALFKDNQNARYLMIETMKEVVTMSRVVGVNLEDNAIDRFLAVLETLGSDMKTSMLQDVEAGRQTEVEMLAGKMIKLGKKYGVATPYNEMLYHMLKAIEYKNAFIK